MKTILYATDFSSNAEKALEYACELSMRTGARIVALHVMDVPTMLGYPETRQPTFPDIERKVMEHNKHRLKSLCERCLQNTSGGVGIQPEVRMDRSPARSIMTMIGEAGADIVVMGTRGESIVRNVLMGSTTRKVIEEASCPVLAVPNAADYHGIRNIAYACDFEEDNIQAIKMLTWIAGLFDARINVVQVISEQDYADEEKIQWFKEKLLAKVSYQKLSFQPLFANDVYERLNAYLTGNDFQLITMLERRNKSLFEQWFHRDKVQRMVFHSTIPVLSFNEHCLALAKLNKMKNYLHI